MNKDKHIEERNELIKLIYYTPVSSYDGRTKDELVADLVLASGYRKQEWISVKDRLPEKFINVLCLYPSKNYGSNIVVDYMESDSGYFAEQFRYGVVTHWMPLPEPPTEKEI